MNSLQVIEHACAQAMEEAEEETHGWQAAFVSIADPLTVRELCAIARQFMQYAADKGDQALVDDLRRGME
jgi:hypothetical protein